MWVWGVEWSGCWAKSKVKGRFGEGSPVEDLGIVHGFGGDWAAIFETALLLCCLFEGLQDGRDGLGIWGSGRVLLGLGGRGVWEVRRWDGPGGMWWVLDAMEDTLDGI